MSSKNQVVSVRSTSGRSVLTELKDLLRPVMLDAFLCHHHSLVISEKGWGKSEMGQAMAEQVFGVENVVSLNGTAAMKPSKISGRPNPRWELNPQEAIARGEPSIFVDGTPYDPNANAVIFHEMTRPNEFTLDELIEAMDYVSRRHKAVMVGNANWLNVTPRTEAIYDRVNSVVIYTPSRLSLEEFTDSTPPSTWTYELPTFNEIQEVANFPITQSALDLVRQVFRAFDVQLAATTFRPNPRRAASFRETLIRVSQYHAGSPNICEIHPDAFAALEWAWPVTTIEQSLEWRKIVSALYDQEGAAIAEFQKTAFAQWKQVFDTNRRNPEAVRVALGNLMQEAENTLIDQFGETPRVNEALRMFDSWYTKACRGETFGG